MPKLYNFEFKFEGYLTYTAETEEEARRKLENDVGEVEATLVNKDEYDPYSDDFMDGR